MSKFLIINCDDLGPNTNVLDGLVSFQSKIVTSASVITNYGNLDLVSDFSHSQKKFGLGVHLNFTSGRPILPLKKIPSLVKTDGIFHGRESLIQGIKINPYELELEFEAQILELIKFDIQPTHLDNHHPEIYLFPELFTSVLNLAVKYSLPIRFPFTPNFFLNIQKYVNLFNCSVDFLKEKSLELLKLCERFGVNFPNYFIIDFTLDKSKDTLLDIINNLEIGISEICVHLGSNEPKLQKELNVIRDPNILKLIESNNIELISYSIFNNN